MLHRKCVICNRIVKVSMQTYPCVRKYVQYRNIRRESTPPPPPPQQQNIPTPLPCQTSAVFIHFSATLKYRFIGVSALEMMRIIASAFIFLALGLGAGGGGDRLRKERKHYVKFPLREQGNNSINT
jgi:hypothetical protein